jgi:hypothetical protein
VKRRGFVLILLGLATQACGTPPPGPRRDASLDQGQPDLAGPSVGIERPTLVPLGVPPGGTCDEQHGCDPQYTCLLGKCSEWASVAKVQVALTGARREGPLRDFPLLVRLPPDSPVFAHALPRGEDLRFTTMDQESLDHEVEVWDGTAHQGHIWVRIPLIRPDQATIDLLVFAGNPQAANTSDGARVFPDHDFVYHLSTPDLRGEFPVFPGSTPGASPLRVDQPLAAAEGIAGRALALDGTGWPCEAAVPESGSGEASTSLWFRARAADGGALTSLSAQGNQTALLWLDGEGRLRFSVRDGNRFMTISSLTNHADGRWHQVYTVITPAGPRLFVDGDLIAEGTSTAFYLRPAGTLAFGTLDGNQLPFLLGELAPPPPFKGDLDELRSLPLARSPSWIALSYAVERPDETAPALPTGSGE